MSDDNKQEIARQLLAILREQEPGKGFDLMQLSDVIGASSVTELEQVAEALKAQGVLELVEIEPGRKAVVLLPEGEEGQGSCVPTVKMRKAQDESIIVDTSVGLMSGSSESTVKQSVKSDNGRGVVTTTSSPAKSSEGAADEWAQTTVKKADSAASSTGNVTIKQILDSLAEAIEQSERIEDREKWPLVEKIRAVSGHRAIQSWLSAPLRSIVE